MKLEQAARQLLSVLEQGLIDINSVTALREALAEPKKPEECANGCPQLQVCDYCQTAEQPVQEPVAWCYFCEDALWGFFTDPDECDPDCDNEMPLYAAPVRTKDLTDDEIEAIMVEQGDLRTTVFARAVISADREKNK